MEAQSVKFLLLITHTVLPREKINLKELSCRYEVSLTPIKMALNRLVSEHIHQMYLKCSGNRKMVDVYNSLNPFLYATYIFHLQSKQKDIASVEEHKMIFGSVIRQDESALEKAQRLYIENVKNSISLLLKVQQFM